MNTLNTLIIAIRTEQTTALFSFMTFYFLTDLVFVLFVSLSVFFFL